VEITEAEVDQEAVVRTDEEGQDPDLGIEDVETNQKVDHEADLEIQDQDRDLIIIIMTLEEDQEVIHQEEGQKADQHLQNQFQKRQIITEN